MVPHMLLTTYKTLLLVHGMQLCYTWNDTSETKHHLLET